LEDVVELRSYLLIVWRKRCLILAAFLSTLLSTMIITFLQTPVYEATSTFVVTPSGTYRNAESLASVLDLMSRRAELASTYAEVAASRSIKQEAADQFGLSEAQREDLTVESRLLPGTNVLEIKVQGNDARMVSAFTDKVGALAANYTRTLYEAYGLQPLDMADLPTSPVQPNKIRNLALGTALGLAFGVSLALLAFSLAPPLQEAVSQRPAGTPPGSSQEAAVAATRTSRLELAGWIVVGLLTVAVIGMGFALFLAEPETSAAGLPVSRPVATFVPAALWTATPNDATSPDINPTPCIYPRGWVAYEVQVADTLTSLAQRYDMSVAEIADANCLTRRVISAGQLLYFPPSPDTATPVPSITATESVTFTPERVVPLPGED
jgi:capsular polysaccharide biosynthesis protein